MDNANALPRRRVSRRLAVAAGLAVVAVAGALGFAVAIATVDAAQGWRVSRNNGPAVVARAALAAIAVAAALAAVLPAAVVVSGFSAAMLNVD